MFMSATRDPSVVVSLADAIRLLMLRRKVGGDGNDICTIFMSTRIRSKTKHYHVGLHVS